MNVSVDPPAFTIVDYDAGRIAAVAAEVAALVGLPDDVRIEVVVDEENPFGKASTMVVGRAVTIAVEGGAFEDPQQLRQFSEPNARARARPAAVPGRRPAQPRLRRPAS